MALIDEHRLKKARERLNDLGVSAYLADLGRHIDGLGYGRDRLQILAENLFTKGEVSGKYELFNELSEMLKLDVIDAEVAAFVAGEDLIATMQGLQKEFEGEVEGFREETSERLRASESYMDVDNMPEDLKYLQSLFDEDMKRQWEEICDHLLEKGIPDVAEDLEAPEKETESLYSRDQVFAGKVDSLMEDVELKVIRKMLADYGREYEEKEREFLAAVGESRERLQEANQADEKALKDMEELETAKMTPEVKEQRAKEIIGTQVQSLVDLRSSLEKQMKSFSYIVKFIFSGFRHSKKHKVALRDIDSLWLKMKSDGASELEKSESFMEFEKKALELEEKVGALDERVDSIMRR